MAFAYMRRLGHGRRQSFVPVAYRISRICNPSIRASAKKHPSEQRPNETRDPDSSLLRVCSPGKKIFFSLLYHPIFLICQSSLINRDKRFSPQIRQHVVAIALAVSHSCAENSRILPTRNSSMANGYQV